MNIQRKYSLPNCTLLLEGLSDAARATHYQEMRPELSILVNAECHIHGYKQPLVGGREFFESLVRAVSGYAQEFLSNVSNPQAHNQEAELVELQKIDTNKHRLIVHSEVTTDGFESNPNYNKPPIQIDLNTVQLFDLVEAVDQFFADSQTLPELSLELQPVPRRYGSGNQALLKQAVPASIGISSVAVAAIAFSLIPAPEIRPPEPKPQEESSTTAPNTDSAVLTPPTPEAETPAPAPTPINVVSPAPTAPTATAATATAPKVTDLEALLNTVTEITDPSQLRALNRQVYNQINPTWTERSTIRQDLVYRVGVAADGAIVGYKAVNEGANAAIELTPLPNLLYNPANRPPIANEPIAQFKVVFTDKGVLQVSPWRGYARTPDVVGAKITDANEIKTLNQKLYDTVRKNWGGTPSFTRDLRYRVAVNQNGLITDYEPLNQVAFDHFRETPLPTMFQEIYGSNVAAPNNQEPLAHFQVTFSPSGSLEIAPWQGYR